MFERRGRWPEHARKAGLALACAAFVARACWPGEGADEATTFQGIAWVIAALLAAGLAIIALGFQPKERPRWHWVDASFFAFITVVAFSAAGAADKRVAINLAWHWAGVALLYGLARALPRGPAEHRAVVTVLVATGAALACYGLYQVAVLYPEARRAYRENPLVALQSAGVATDPASRQGFEQRLFASQEPMSTFSLANSLAGFLIPPVLLLAGAAIGGGARHGARPRWIRLAALLCCGMPLIACLLLTKSRTAYIGLLVGLGVLAARQFRTLRPRAWLIAGSAFILGIAALVAAGLATRQLDRLVLTESWKSLRYRWEYWVGTWGVLTDGPTWWRGLGPGNFAGPYLRHKLAVASEGIKDPHNAFLEVWSTAGLVALVLFLLTCGLGVVTLWTREKGTNDAPQDNDPPRGARWLVWWSGLGGLALAMLVRPDLSPFAHSANPFEGDFDRWVVLLVAWSAAAWLLRSGAIADFVPPAAYSAAFLGVLVNLLGAGGIGFAPVAAMLWMTLALGVNVRERGESKTATREPRWLLVGLVLWAALAGTFVGTMAPAYMADWFMKTGETYQDRARRAMQSARTARPADPLAARGELLAQKEYEAAAKAFSMATSADRYASRPWLLWGLVDLEGWDARGRPIPDFIWHRLKSQLQQAHTPPRDSNSFPIASTEFQVANRLLGIAGWPPVERAQLLRDRLDAAQRCARLNPTSAGVQADLAYAAEDSGDLRLAISAGARALEIDTITPHPDKKLPKSERARLETNLVEWQARE